MDEFTGWSPLRYYHWLRQHARYAHDLAVHCVLMRYSRTRADYIRRLRRRLAFRGKRGIL